MKQFLLLPAMIAALGIPTVADEINIRSNGSVTTLSGAAFGTTFTVKVAGKADSQDARNLVQPIRETIDRLNSQMSLWDDESELSRFNRSVGEEWFAVSTETVDVVDAALRLRDVTAGAFDPTVKPLLDLWSFGPGVHSRRVPSDAEVTQARRWTGASIETRRSPEPALRKAHDDVQLDLNAIAKGYAVDVFAELVDGLRPHGFMVEIGGEVRTSGTKPDGSPWRIAIEQPVAGSRIMGSAITLSDAALATSGDYRNYFEVDGRRYSHTIDPRTGRPVTHKLTSVSVLAADCLTADAWATALLVAGPDAGYNLAAQENIAALFLIRDGQTLRSRATAGFPEVDPIAQPLPESNSWSMFLLTAAVFGLAIAGMAVGVILSNRRLHGSCGGVNGLKDERGNPLCDACTTPREECDEFRKQNAGAANSDD